MMILKILKLHSPIFFCCMLPQSDNFSVWPYLFYLFYFIYFIYYSLCILFFIIIYFIILLVRSVESKTDYSVTQVRLAVGMYVGVGCSQHSIVRRSDDAVVPSLSASSSARSSSRSLLSLSGNRVWEVSESGRRRSDGLEWSERCQLGWVE